MLDGQRIAYWTTYAASVAFVVAGLVFKSFSFGVLGAAILIVLVLSNPAFQILDRLINVRLGPTERGFILNRVDRLFEIVGPLVDGIGSKVAGKVNPEFAAAVKALNTAHENDKLNDNRLTQIESKLNALSMAAGIQRKRPSDVVGEFVG
jgi:hypothetical protein